jgi:hypothetical protein
VALRQTMQQNQNQPGGTQPPVQVTPGQPGGGRGGVAPGQPGGRPGGRPGGSGQPPPIRVGPVPSPR